MINLTTRLKAARALLGLAVACGALLALTPRWLLPVCADKVKTAAGGLTPMRCAWSANVLIALGVVAVVLAVVGLLTRSGTALGMNALALTCIFALAILVPTKLIGVCGAPTHPCRAATLPAVLAVAGLGLLVSVAAGVLVTRSIGRREAEVPQR